MMRYKLESSLLESTDSSFSSTKAVNHLQTATRAEEQPPKTQSYNDMAPFPSRAPPPTPPDKVSMRSYAQSKLWQCSPLQPQAQYPGAMPMQHQLHFVAGAPGAMSMRRRTTSGATPTPTQPYASGPELRPTSLSGLPFMGPAAAGFGPTHHGYSAVACPTARTSAPGCPYPPSASASIPAAPTAPYSPYLGSAAAGPPPYIPPPSAVAAGHRYLAPASAAAAGAPHLAPANAASAASPHNPTAVTVESAPGPPHLPAAAAGPLYLPPASAAAAAPGHSFLPTAAAAAAQESILDALSSSAVHNTRSSPNPPGLMAETSHSSAGAAIAGPQRRVLRPVLSIRNRSDGEQLLPHQKEEQQHKRCLAYSLSLKGQQDYMREQQALKPQPPEVPEEPEDPVPKGAAAAAAAGGQPLLSLPSIQSRELKPQQSIGGGRGLVRGQSMNGRQESIDQYPQPRERVIMLSMSIPIMPSSSLKYIPSQETTVPVVIPG